MCCLNSKKGRPGLKGFFHTARHVNISVSGTKTKVFKRPFRRTFQKNITGHIKNAVILRYTANKVKFSQVKGIPPPPPRETLWVHCAQSLRP